MTERAVWEHIELVQGDITQQAVDAIVNAANESLLGGGGVDGAIHRAAGPGLLSECRTLGGCPTGEACVTRGYQLSAKHVIHTVGPVYHGGSRGEAKLLARCHTNSMRLAEEHDCRSVAFPAISCGVYGYPIAEAAKVALTTVADYLAQASEPVTVRWVLFSDHDLDVFQGTLAKLRKG